MMTTKLSLLTKKYHLRKLRRLKSHHPLLRILIKSLRRISERFNRKKLSLRKKRRPSSRIRESICLKLLKRENLPLLK